MGTFGFAQGHRRKVAIMRISPLVLLFAMLGCGSGTEPAKTPAESDGKQTVQSEQIVQSAAVQTEGFASPKEVSEAYQAARAANDDLAALRCLSPKSQDIMAVTITVQLAILSRLEPARKQAIVELLAKHGIELSKKLDLNSRFPIEDRSDKVAYIADASKWMRDQDRVKVGDPVGDGALGAISIEGDSAHATYTYKSGKTKDIEFVRLNGRWFLQSSIKPKGLGTEPAKIPDAATVKKQMTPAQLALGDPVVNSVGMVLVPIPAGEFQMGSPDSEAGLWPDDGKPQHLVKITKPFYLGVYEVTQSQYEKVMGSRPWQGKNSDLEGPDYPASFVIWDDAVAFCRKLSKQEGVEYRLPTEAEWEYACRAGTTTAYSFGDNESKLGQYAWYDKNAWDIDEAYAHRVGRKLPNPWGLYDMHGNVWEWCQDWYAPYGTEKTVSDPMGPARGTSRLLRGGSFFFQSSYVRSAFRYNNRPPTRYVVIGFRPSRTYNLSP
jgi:formylglycine-generating enzyme required for sulfatase activity